MGNTTAIEWTDATWNPVTGCTKISAGCDNCYAERFSERFRGVSGHPFENGFDLILRPERLDQPLRWREPRMIFVNSMSDLFHKEVPDEFIARVCDTMERAYWHTFQVLTKRSSLMRDFLRRRYGKCAGDPSDKVGSRTEGDGARCLPVRVPDEPAEFTPKFDRVLSPAPGKRVREHARGIKAALGKTRGSSEI